MGTLRGSKAKIQVQEGIKPKLFKPRTVHNVLKAKVGTELDRLVKHGIITPIQFSDWAVPIVPVVKQWFNCSVRGLQVNSKQGVSFRVISPTKSRRFVLSIIWRKGILKA